MTHQPIKHMTHQDSSRLTNPDPRPMITEGVSVVHLCLRHVPRPIYYLHTIDLRVKPRKENVSPV